LIIGGCSLEKKNGFNRAMQNLTAHYNILYNANEILRQKQESYAGSYIDSYGSLLSVYQDTIAQSNKADKDLDAAIAKANTIINEKEQSHYIGDAYLILGKANFLAGKYFDAVEFFNYVIRSSSPKKQLKLIEEAEVWKIRALLYLGNKKEAKLALDSAFARINPKKTPPADVYAAALLYDINTQNYAEAEDMAKKAIKYTGIKREELRWTFILGQLQELNHHTNDAIISYTSIVKSNASFEMAFNADLNRIRIEDMRNGIKMNRISLLLSLLKEENNQDFKDQIYYQVAEIYLADKDINNAVKYYKLSVRNSIKNQNQKGLSYLRIADIDFNNRADYVSAKKYYDSTLTNLSPNYPGYQTIQKKSNNLQVLVDKLQIISREDTLQMLAKLDEPARKKRIDALVEAQILQQQAAANAIAANNAYVATQMQGQTQTSIRGRQAGAATGTSFYFYNAAAVSRGYTDFKRIWGDRKLADNWRLSSRANGNSASTVNNSPTATAGAADPDAIPATLRKSTTDVAAGGYRQDLVQNLPLTPTLLAQSNTRIYNAYIDIGNFYRDILDDKKDAIATFELVLARFPADPNKAFVYYNLYRLYSDIDIAKSNDYKNRLLKEYPETVFAKVIIDPDYSKKMGDNDSRFNNAYNIVYDLYRQRKYTAVMISADSLAKEYPTNPLAAQLYYLRAMAMGHMEKVEPFKADLQSIVTNYPKDRLIAPLVIQHLAYIQANEAELSAQNFAIMDSDTTGALFSPPVENQKETPYNRNRQYTKIVEQQVVAKPAEKVTVQAPVVNKPVEQPVPVKEKPVAKTISKTFSTRDSTNYYFVINVSTGTTDLSSSRFGVGQFNRTSFRASGVTHQLKNAGRDNQLIYIGRFKNLNEVKDYARAIIPLLPDIMKVPKDKYSFFIITRENLDKLADRKLLDEYIDYYQQTY
jgi:tetratricopeptide (TPR) repeat protein